MNFFKKLIQSLGSRTVWSVIVLFIVNGIEGIREFISVDWLPFIDGILGMAIVYFRANPRVKFE